MKNSHLPADVREQSASLAEWLDEPARIKASFAHEIEQALMTQRSRGLQEGLGMALQIMSESGDYGTTAASAILRLISKLRSVDQTPPD